MSKLSVQKQITLNIVIGTIGLVLILVFIIMYIGKINNLQIVIENSHDRLEEDIFKASHLKKSLKDTNRLDEVNEICNEGTVDISSDEKKIQFLTDLENLAEQYDLTQDLKISDQSTSDDEIDLNYYTISFNSFGSFDNLIRYIRALESEPYYIIIDSTKWNYVSDAEVDTGTSLVFSGKIYVRD